jgi:NAD-dependent DNA ligase
MKTCNRNTPSLNLFGATVVFTGFRDAFLKSMIERKGGRVTSAVSGQTTMVVTKDFYSQSNKATSARSRGVLVVTRDQLEAVIA